MKRYIQLRDYAKKHSITYRTAWNKFMQVKFQIALKMRTIIF
jgi:hypothetical protein